MHWNPERDAELKKAVDEASSHGERITRLTWVWIAGNVSGRVGRMVSAGGCRKRWYRVGAPPPRRAEREPRELFTDAERERTEAEAEDMPPTVERARGLLEDAPLGTHEIRRMLVDAADMLRAIADALQSGNVEGLPQLHGPPATLPKTSLPSVA